MVFYSQYGEISFNYFVRISCFKVNRYSNAKKSLSLQMVFRIHIREQAIYHNVNKIPY